jgi:fimbrial chaperone protein
MHLFMKLKPIDSRLLLWGSILLVACLLLPQTALCGAFAARISPPNFELKTKPGEVLRNVIMIENAGEDEAIYQVRTADWDMSDTGGVKIYPADQPLPSASCRPWTRIERRTFKLQPSRRKNFRFEVHVPEDAVSRECRFAIVISPTPETVNTMNMGSLQIPVAGAIAVIVYVAIGDAEPDLEFKSIDLKRNEEESSPVIFLHNKGNAHARPFGNVKITDAEGKKAELIISPFPILPGRTTGINLSIDSEFSKIEDISELKPPLRLKGLIEWDGGEYKLDTVMTETP